MEIVLIPKGSHGRYTLYPGLFLFSTPARLIRPVLNLISNTTEYIGTFEQVYLGICITHEEFVPGVSIRRLLLIVLKIDFSILVYYSSRINPVQFLIDYS